MSMEIQPENIQMGKDEIKARVKEAITAYLKKWNQAKGGYVAVLMEVEEGKPIFKTAKFHEDGSQEVIEDNNTEGFFRDCILSLAENVAQKIQVKFLLKSIGKKIFPEIEAALLNSLEEGQSVLIGLLGANLSVSLWEKGRFQKQINIDELI